MSRFPTLAASTALASIWSAAVLSPAFADDIETVTVTAERLNEARIGIAGATAKLMIQMTNNQTLVARVDQPMQKCD